MIEVRITGAEIMKHDHHTFAPYINSELKKVGIPVMGHLVFRGVERGRIAWFQDYWSTDMIFRWEE